MITSKIPPELMEAIIYLLTAALGWVARWLKDRKKMDRLTVNAHKHAITNLELESERGTLVNEVRLMNERFNELGEFAKNQSNTIQKLRSNANEKL